MAAVPETLLTRSSRTLLIGQLWLPLARQSAPSSFGQRCPQQRYVPSARTDASREGRATTTLPTLDKAPSDILTTLDDRAAYGPESKHDDSSEDNSHGSSRVLRPLRFLLDRLFAQQQQQQQKQNPFPHNRRQVDSVAPSGVLIPGKESMQSTEDAPNGAGADGSHDKRSIAELRAAAEWELQRAYALLKRLDHQQEAKQSSSSNVASGTSQVDTAGATDKVSTGLDGLQRLHPLQQMSVGNDSSKPTTEKSEVQVAGSHQSRARRLRGWVRMPSLPQLSGQLRGPPIPDLPPVQVSHPAVQLAWRRARAGSRPGARTDNAKLGLVVEGGGMRGVISAGSLMSLYELGLKDAFDAVYGTSAGAINCTYFLTGQREGVDIYPEDIANKLFLDLRRFVSRNTGPVMDLGFLIDHIMTEIKPLRWDDVISSNVPLKVVASCLDALGPVVLQDFHDKEDLQTCLKASANVPVIAGTPVLHRGRRLVDGAVFESIPFRQAIADGCTHIVVLCTRPPFRGGRLKKAVSDFVEASIKRQLLNPDFMRLAWRAELQQITEQHMTGDEMLVLSLQPGSAQELPMFQGAYIAPLYASSACSISPVCIDSEVLRGGIVEGRRIVAATFDPDGLGMPDAVRARLAPDVRAAIKRAAAQQAPPSTAVTPALPRKLSRAA